MRKEIPTSDIGNIVSKINTWNPTRSNQKTPFIYIDLSSVDQKEKRIDVTSKINPEEAPSRARQIVFEGDVLVSTVRPNLNGIAYVPSELNGATASTGFCVLRPNKSVLENRYLYHWVQSPQFVGEMVKLATGASYPAISDQIVKNSKIPLPPLTEQKRIAAILDKADAIRRKRQAAIKLADDFLRATFLDIFGDPVTNPKGWATEVLGEYCEEMRYGTSVKCSTVNIKNNLPVLRIPNVTEEKINYKNLVYAELPTQEQKKLKLLEGDLLFVRTNGNPEYIGRCAVFNGSSNMLFASYLIRARLKTNCELIPEYIHACISSRSYRKIIIKEAKTTAGNFNINTQGLKNLIIPIAPLALQKKYLEIKTIIEKIILKNTLSSSEGISIFNSLTQRAFRGDL